MGGGGIERRKGQEREGALKDNFTKSLNKFNRNPRTAKITQLLTALFFNYPLPPPTPLSLAPQAEEHNINKPRHAVSIETFTALELYERKQCLCRR